MYKKINRIQHLAQQLKLMELQMVLRATQLLKKTIHKLHPNKPQKFRMPL